MAITGSHDYDYVQPGAPPQVTAADIAERATQRLHVGCPIAFHGVGTYSSEKVMAIDPESNQMTLYDPAAPPRGLPTMPLQAGQTRDWFVGGSSCRKEWWRDLEGFMGSPPFLLRRPPHCRSSDRGHLRGSLIGERN